MSGDNNLKHFVRKTFLQPDMTASLTNYYPSISMKGVDDLLIIYTRNLAHTAISTCSELEAKIESSSTGSR